MKATKALATIAVATLGLVSCNRNADTTIAPLTLDSISYTDTMYIQLSEEHIVSISMQGNYVYPTNNDSVRYHLNAQMFSPVVADSAPDKIIESYFHNIVLGDLSHGEAFTEVSKEEWEKSSPTPLQYEYSVSNTFVPETEASYIITSYEYTGGAHGYTSNAYYTVDPKSGRAIQEADIFVDDYKEQLAKAIKDELLRKNKEDDFFSINEVVGNGNFIITKQGLRYCYNPYEIAPYAFGTVIVDLPWENLRNIVRPGSVAAAYLQP